MEAGSVFPRAADCGTVILRQRMPLEKFVFYWYCEDFGGAAFLPRFSPPLLYHTSIFLSPPFPWICHLSQLV